MDDRLVFLKLGGSLLGDKRHRRSFRAGVVKRLGREIAEAVRERGLHLVLAHGAAGFGHHPAKKNHTRDGLVGGGGWSGFAETRRGVLELNRLVLGALSRGGLEPVLVPPSAGVVARKGGVSHWDLRPIREILKLGQVPLIHGDAVLDVDKAFTILSTEELFLYLAQRLRPRHVILASDVEGVYFDIMPNRARRRIIPHIGKENIDEVRVLIGGAPTRTSLAGKPVGACRKVKIHDVTGAMASKVDRLYDISRRLPGAECRIVSGLIPGVVHAALMGKDVGTVIDANVRSVR